MNTKIKIVSVVIFSLALIFSLDAPRAAASSCQTIGNTSYCSDGTSYQQIGNTVYGSNGTSYQTIGNTTYGNDGTSYQQIGNTTYANNGTSYQNIGNSTYGSDGSMYQTIGNTTYGSGNTYSICPANSSSNLSGGCSCNYGYIVGSSGTCVNGNNYCENQIGLMSEYNNSTKQCECMVGYEFDGSTCVSKDYSNSYPTVYYNNPSTCPLNSHVSTSDATKCSCDAGYQVNSTGDSCVIQVTKTNSQLCQDSYGFNADWDGTYDTSNGQLNCNCISGFVWNSSRTACMSAPVIENPVTPVVDDNPVTENIPTVESETAAINKPLIIKKTGVFKKNLVETSTASSTSSSTKPVEEKSGWWNSSLGWFGFK